MENYAYTTLLSTNEYFKFLPHFISVYRMQECKYPLHVILTDNINENVQEYLKKENISFTIFPLLKFQKDSRHQTCINKFYVWKLPYDKVAIIDINTYFFNLDTVLQETKPPRFIIRRRWSSINSSQILTLDGKFYIVEPNEDIFNELIEISKECNNEESVLNKKFLKDSINNLPLSEYGNVIEYSKMELFTHGVMKLPRNYENNYTE